MDFKKEDIEEFIGLLQTAETFRPVVRLFLDTLKSYSEEIKEIPEAFSRWLVKNRIDSIKQYEAAGFSRNDAILMTLDDIYGLRKANEILNKKKAATDVYTMLAAGWFSLEELPEYFSFRCLIKFREFGTDGIDKNHVSTGYWWHRDKAFSIDNKEMRNFTPEYFIPIYSDIT